MGVGQNRLQTRPTSGGSVLGVGQNRQVASVSDPDPYPYMDPYSRPPESGFVFGIRIRIMAFK